jgi:hypothetical protein
MIRHLQSLGSALGELWCQAMHADAMWPVNGEYRCKTCLRTYKVAWEHKASEPAPTSDKTVSISAGKRITAAEARVA